MVYHPTLNSGCNAQVHSSYGLTNVRSGLPLTFNLNCTRTLRRHNTHPTSLTLQKLHCSEHIMQDKICLWQNVLMNLTCSPQLWLVQQLQNIQIISSLPGNSSIPPPWPRLTTTRLPSSTSTLAHLTQSPQPSCKLHHPSLLATDIFNALAALDTSQAMAIDGIGPEVLKSCALALHEPLFHLFSRTL